ncbi:MAG: sulfotransferase [Myxococcota bacterium]|nr:sulfotransferase [Myxococcota bacterium]
MALKCMADRFERPDWVRRMNAMADALGGADVGARRVIPIDPDALFAEALESVGGEDIGDFGDPLWRERFTTLAAAIDRSNMHVVGRLQSREELFRSLRTRLLLNRRWAETPAIADEEIAAPLVVTGPARSGTSITFELLWLDPRVRGPLAWEVLHPIPQPEGGDDRRLAATECEQEFWADVQPEFAAIHELRSDLPVECVTLTQPCFAGSHWPMVAQLKGWEADMTEAYAFEKRLLQVLQYGEEKKTWLLKTPGHVMTIDLLFATFPDVQVVQTHRDPAKTMPSTVSTTAMVQWLRTSNVDLDQLVPLINAAFGASLNSVAERRASGDLPAQFGDIHFQSLLSNPVDTIRRAYDQLGRAFLPEHGEAITEYVANKPKGKFGVHKYTPEEWGFSAESLRSGLGPYIDAFGIELE